jgi:Protein of unknown function (DUF3667)
MEQTTCKNCDNIYTGPFCNNCGQKTPHRFTLSHIFHELVHVFVHADKSFLSLVPKILTRPGMVALDYVEGRRKRYFNLFQYLLIIVGISTFLMSQTHFIENMTKSLNTMTSTSVSARQMSFQEKSSAFMQKYMNIIQMILIPIYAFFGWLFLGRKKYNYAENIVLHTAITSQTSTFAALMYLPFVFVSSMNVLWFTSVFVIVTIACYAIAYRQFYKLALGKSILFAFLIFSVAYFVQILLTVLITIVYLIIRKISTGQVG